MGRSSKLPTFSKELTGTDDCKGRPLWDCGKAGQEFVSTRDITVHTENGYVGWSFCCYGKLPISCDALQLVSLCFCNERHKGGQPELLRYGGTRFRQTATTSIEEEKT